MIILSLGVLHRFCDGYSASVLNRRDASGGLAPDPMSAEWVCLEQLGAISIIGAVGVACLIAAWLLRAAFDSRKLLRLSTGLDVAGILVALYTLGTLFIPLVAFNRSDFVEQPAAVAGNPVRRIPDAARPAMVEAPRKSPIENVETPAPRRATELSPAGRYEAPGRAAAANQVLALDGHGDYVDVRDSTDALDTGSSFTIEAWFRSPEPETEQVILMYGFTNADGKNNALKLDRGRLRFNVRGYGREYDHVIGQTELSAGKWYHGAFVYAGIEGRLYLNGELEATVQTTVNMDANSRVLLGVYNNPKTGFLGKYFQGELDEVRIWSRARSQGEIVSYMRRALSGRENALVAYYDFDQGDGGRIVDRAGDNVGMMVGQPVRVPSDPPWRSLPVTREPNGAASPLDVPAPESWEFEPAVAPSPSFCAYTVSGAVGFNCTDCLSPGDVLCPAAACQSADDCQEGAANLIKHRCPTPRDASKRSGCTYQVQDPRCASCTPN